MATPVPVPPLDAHPSKELEREGEGVELPVPEKVGFSAVRVGPKTLGVGVGEAVPAPTVLVPLPLLVPPPEVLERGLLDASLGEAVEDRVGGRVVDAEGEGVPLPLPAPGDAVGWGGEAEGEEVPPTPPPLEAVPPVLGLLWGECEAPVEKVGGRGVLESTGVSLLKPEALGGVVTLVDLVLNDVAVVVAVSPSMEGVDTLLVEARPVPLRAPLLEPPTEGVVAGESVPPPPTADAVLQKEGVAAEDSLPPTLLAEVLKEAEGELESDQAAGLGDTSGVRVVEMEGDKVA